MSQSSKLLMFFVNDMLDFAQILQGKFRKVVESFDLKEAVAEVISIQKFQTESKDINIIVRFLLYYEH